MTLARTAREALGRRLDAMSRAEFERVAATYSPELLAAEGDGATTAGLTEVITVRDDPSGSMLALDILFDGKVDVAEAVVLLIEHVPFFRFLLTLRPEPAATGVRAVNFDGSWPADWSDQAAGAIQDLASALGVDIQLEEQRVKIEWQVVHESPQREVTWTTLSSSRHQAKPQALHRC